MTRSELREGRTFRSKGNVGAEYIILQLKGEIATLQKLGGFGAAGLRMLTVGGLLKSIDQWTDEDEEVNTYDTQVPALQQSIREENFVADPT